MKEQVNAVADAAIAAPPVAVTSALVLGLSLSDWVIVLNLLYIVIAIVWKVFGIYKEHKNGSKQ